MSILSKIFGGGGWGNGAIRQALQDGGVIIDLRTAYEYDQGHIPRSLNIPVDRIRANIGRIRDLNKPVILCCAGGMHCVEAADTLKKAGIGQVHIGGSWENVWRAMRK
ncbi:MAG TPA: rhodanese-like domain-containing protein [Puia sp.]|nr:rhodanese-like domain-containing protein [Puia sp.]